MFLGHGGQKQGTVNKLKGAEEEQHKVKLGGKWGQV